MTIISIIEMMDYLTNEKHFAPMTSSILFFYKSKEDNSTLCQINGELSYNPVIQLVHGFHQIL